MEVEEYESKSIKEFSRFAHFYDTYNIIQRKVAKKLIRDFPAIQYDKIIDIGCGSGTLYRCIINNDITIPTFIALDSSTNMLALHPDSAVIKKYSIDFDDKDAFSHLDITSNSLFLSSSALQWSQDLDSLFFKLSNLSKHIHLSIFTSNTFHTLHKCAKIDSPIYSAQILKNVISKYYNVKFELKTYKLYFDNTRDMFKYIKKSGVSGGKKKLSFLEIKELMLRYPLDYLEFEILFVTTVLPTGKKF